MRTSILAICVVLFAAAVLPLPAQAQDRDRAPFGHMMVDGVIMSVEPGSSTFLLHVFRSDRTRRFEFDSLAVWVQRGTRINDEDDDGFRRSLIWGFHRGDRVTVDGFRLDDGRLLALAIDVRERAAIFPPVYDNDLVIRGVVVALAPNFVVILEAGGGTRIIIISATTRFRGPRASWSALQAHDQVVVVGQTNADGSVAAREVQVIAVSR